MYEAVAERLHGVIHLLIFLFLNLFIFILFIDLFSQTTYHRIEDTRNQVQYPMYQSLKILIKKDIYH